MPVPAPPPKPVEHRPRPPRTAPPQRLPGIPGPRGTRTLAREEAAWAASASPARPPRTLPARRRSRRVFGAWAAVVRCSRWASGLTAWWLGNGRWTAVPSVVGVRAGGRRAAAHRRGPRAATVGSSMRRGGRRAGDGGGARRRRRGCCAAARYARRLPRPARRCRPIAAGTAGGGRGAGRDPRRRSSRPCGPGRASTARRSRRAAWCAPTRRRARRCRAAAASTLVVSRGEQPAASGARAVPDRRAVRRGDQQTSRTWACRPRSSGRVRRPAGRRGAVRRPVPRPGQHGRPRHDDRLRAF